MPDMIWGKCQPQFNTIPEFIYWLDDNFRDCRDCRMEFLVSIMDGIKVANYIFGGADEVIPYLFDCDLHGWTLIGYEITDFTVRDSDQGLRELDARMAIGIWRDK